jgi:hypothetical protein
MLDATGAGSLTRDVRGGTQRFSMRMKAQLERAERDWRHFVFGSRFTRVAFLCGVGVALLSILTPHSVTALLMGYVVPIWFGCYLLYFVSAHMLTLAVSLIRKDALTSIWMAVWTAGLVLLASYILALGFRGALTR